MARKTEKPDAACSFIVGDDGLSRWGDVHRQAWIGMLETHKRLTRRLEAELEAEHGLSLSALELMGRLAAADDRLLTLSHLADRTGLSLSRVSRIVDSLEDRKLVERKRCPNDARARNAWLTDAGLDLVREAQAMHFGGVEREFFQHMDASDIEALAAVFTRFAPDAEEECAG